MQDCSSRRRNLAPATGTLPTSELHQFVSPPAFTARTHEAIRLAAGGQVTVAKPLQWRTLTGIPAGISETAGAAPLYTTDCGLLKQPNKLKMASVGTLSNTATCVSWHRAKWCWCGSDIRRPAPSAKRHVRVKAQSKPLLGLFPGWAASGSLPAFGSIPVLRPAVSETFLRHTS